MATAFQEPGPDGKKFLWLDLGNDVLIFANSGTPADGAVGTGTMAGLAGPGSLCLSYTTNLKLYVNGGTKASPVWKLVTSA